MVVCYTRIMKVVTIIDSGILCRFNTKININIKLLLTSLASIKLALDYTRFAF